MTIQSSFETASGPIYKISGRIMTEAQIGAAMRALAREEGHMPRLPDNRPDVWAGDGKRIGRPKGSILPGSISHQILAYLHGRPGEWATGGQIAEAIGENRRRVADKLFRLAENGHVTRGPKVGGNGSPRLWAAK